MDRESACERVQAFRGVTGSDEMRAVRVAGGWRGWERKGGEGEEGSAGERRAGECRGGQEETPSVIEQVIEQVVEQVIE
ncbi:hypothetical protein [Streptomyces sp. HD]|uniref:hypothetical protein n=1 Tax=Streptomyces sp. HD TaxID=3020892 RepID=UPI00232FA4A3|nr:hypothetical protein [Streptomyces sp. HD]MDC0772423.1 hypothetical protein [Streptomyces sp. HD]